MLIFEALIWFGWAWAANLPILCIGGHWFQTLELRGPCYLWSWFVWARKWHRPIWFVLSICFYAPRVKAGHFHPEWVVCAGRGLRLIMRLLGNESSDLWLPRSNPCRERRYLRVLYVLGHVLNTNIKWYLKYSFWNKEYSSMFSYGFIYVIWGDFVHDLYMSYETTLSIIYTFIWSDFQHDFLIIYKGY